MGCKQAFTGYFPGKGQQVTQSRRISGIELVGQHQGKTLVKEIMGNFGEQDVLIPEKWHAAGEQEEYNEKGKEGKGLKPVFFVAEDAMVRPWLLLQCFRPADDLEDLTGNGSLTGLVVIEFKFADKFGSIICGLMHGGHSGTVFRGV